MREKKKAARSSGAHIASATLAVLSAVLVLAPAQAETIYEVSIDTASLLGSGSTLAFDFIAGGGMQSNSISISNFDTNGTLLSPSLSGAVNSGSVSGALPDNVSLSNASFFNEYQQGITFGSTITFQLTATTNAPSSGSLADTFSLFFLDPTATNSLLTTTDPTGADSLFSLQINGSTGGILGVYSALPSVPVSVTLAPVPLPPGLILLLSGLIGIGSLSLNKRSSPLIRYPQRI